MSELKPWFRHKTIGYGASWPISWEGWAVLMLLLFAIIGIMLGAQVYLTGWERAAAKVAGVLVSVFAFSFVIKRRTEGGWRWRNGDDEA